MKKLSDIHISFGGVSLAQKAFFAKHLSVMLKSGISIGEALLISQSSVEGKLKKILTDIANSVKSGNSLASSMERYPKEFGGLFVNAVRAGEASGTLVGNLETVARQLEKDRRLIAKVKGALLYPSIVISAAFILGLVLSFAVLPKITPLFEGLRVELPFTTRMLIAFSNFIQAYGILFFFGVVGSVVFFLWLLRQEFVHPITHFLLLRIPVVKRLVLHSNLSRFSNMLGTLLRSGVPVGESLDITERALGNYYYKKAVGEAAHRIGKGTSLSENLNNYPKLFPLLAIRMVRVGEESGNFEETLFYLADFYESELDTSTKALSTAIEPLLLLLIGFAVGFLALSIITPIYNITGNIGR
jgi:type IV pilus assembly protein PilC